MLVLVLARSQLQKRSDSMAHAVAYCGLFTPTALLYSYLSQCARSSWSVYVDLLSMALLGYAACTIKVPERGEHFSKPVTNAWEEESLRSCHHLRGCIVNPDKRIPVSS